jgi:hypothetical protein
MNPGFYRANTQKRAIMCVTHTQKRWAHLSGPSWETSPTPAPRPQNSQPPNLPSSNPPPATKGGEGRRRTKCRSPSNPPSSSLLPLFTPTPPPLLLHHRSRCRPSRRLRRLGADARGGIDRSNRSARGGLLGYWWCS